ncbi:hypothetical protein BA6E_101210 [Bacteroidales bacterium 6E]|nr:hypothetical protein BA6E_101210 [Bacteroidales bacterium 6E]
MIVKTVHPHPTLFSGLPAATQKTNLCNYMMFGLSGNNPSVFICCFHGEKQRIGECIFISSLKDSPSQNHKLHECHIGSQAEAAD